MAKGNAIMEMIFEIFLLAAVGVVALVYLNDADLTGLDPAIATILQVVVPLMFGIVIIYRWYSRVK
jgi:hypothetical protein